CARGLGRDYW
nr:immunoglobulin heavy chain junction region [Mus musculus]